MKNSIAFLALVVIGLGDLLVGRADAQVSPGRVRFMKRVGSEFDAYTNSPSSAQQQWMRDHFARMVGVFSPYFDSKLSWFPNAWIYMDLYSIKTDSPLVSQHPDWILKDSSGNRMYI